MSRAPSPLDRFARLPVRWRLAAVSAGLTMVILVGFALVVGQLSADRIRDDFHSELRGAAGWLAFHVQITGAGGEAVAIEQSDLEKVAMADAAAVRVVGSEGEVLAATPGSPPLGPPEPGIRTVGSLDVATAPVITNAIGAPATFVQYARENAEVEATIGRLWLLLATGVLAGTALAAIAGFAVASRAMRPVADLTRAAREIRSTRDTSRRIPQPKGDDEVAELARTLEGMLQAIDASRSEREQAMQSQREFIADASHELRTPLTSVLANLELLRGSLSAEAGEAKDADAAGAERIESVDSALRSSKRMSRLVSDLLLLARADAGRAAPRRECDLAELADAAVDELAPLAGERRLEIDADADLPLEANPDELHRLIANLLDNAVRHTPAGTPVRVTARADGDWAVLEVADEGPGIPGELAEQIFERFVRGSGPADRAADGGTGLGLAIVRAVAESHGGSVEVGRSKGGGARFTVRLPLASEAGLPALSRGS